MVLSNAFAQSRPRRNERKSRLSVQLCFILVAVFCLAVLSSNVLHLGITNENGPLDAEPSLLRIDAPQRILVDTSRPRYARTLVGVMVDFSGHGLRYRRRFRELFPLHPNVCSIGELINPATDTSSCELVYTFVVGAGTEQSVTMRVQTPFLVPSIQRVCDAVPDQLDCLMSDMTLLDITENMNTGKSPTWLAYGAYISKRYGIDYVAKQDTDTILYLDKYFDFAHTNLPPAPFATDIISGWFADKLYWPHIEGDTVVQVSKFAYKTPMSLFVQGQFYLLSTDLATKMAKAISNHTHYSSQGYIEQHEDRDVTSAVLLGSEKQLHFIFISRENLFWQHRVKIKLGKKFGQEWDREINRMKQHIKDSFGDGAAKRMEARVAARRIL